MQSLVFRISRITVLFLAFVMVDANGEILEFNIISNSDVDIYQVSVTGTDVIVSLDKKVDKEFYAYDHFWKSFTSVETIFPQELINTISLNMDRTLEKCGVHVRSKNHNDSKFGDASPVYENVNLSLSPNEKYGVIKSLDGHYLLLNIKNMKFEDICIKGGRNISWKNDSLLAISFDSRLEAEGASRRTVDSVLIYHFDSSSVMATQTHTSNYIQDIQWLEKEATLAIIWAGKATGFSIGKIFSGIFNVLGHPITYEDFSIELFKTNKESKIQVVAQNQKNSYVQFRIKK